MKIVIVGATGYVGSKLLEEAVSRGHDVVAVTRSPGKLPKGERILPVQADVFDADALAEAFKGRDAVIHAYAPAKTDDAETKMERQRAGTTSILAAMKRAGVKRILAVGGAGTLEIAPGVMNMDSPDFPSVWLGGARSTALVKDILRAEPGIEWTFLSPAHNLVPGERTGKFRLGGDQLLVGPDGESRISVEDYAVAMIDELENPKHTDRRFTVGY